MSNNKNEMHHLYMAILNMFIATEFMLSCNDALKETNSYKMQLKSILKKLEPELIRILEHDLKDLWGADDNALQLLQKGFAEFIKGFSIEEFKYHSPEIIHGFGQLMKDFHNAPELVLHRNGIAFIQSEKANQ